MIFYLYRKICRNCKCKQEDHDIFTDNLLSNRGIDGIGRLLMRDKEKDPKPEVQINKPAKNTAEKVTEIKEIPSPNQKEMMKKSEPPPPAPKPTKPSVEKEISAANKSAEIESLIAVIDGQVLDFGASVFAEQAKDHVIVNGDHTEDLPVPPAAIIDLVPSPEPTVDTSVDSLPPPPAEISNENTLPAPPTELPKPITSALHPEGSKQNEVVDSSPAYELPPPPEEIRDDNINETSQVDIPVAKFKHFDTTENKASPPGAVIENTEQDENSGPVQDTINLQIDVTDSESTNQRESLKQVNSESNDQIKDVQVSVSETPVSILVSTNLLKSFHLPCWMLISAHWDELTYTSYVRSRDESEIFLFEYSFHS